MNSPSEKISPTAYATGYLWYRHGLSHPALATPQGKRLDRAFGLLMSGLKLVNGVSFDNLMLSRHAGIDALLTRAIDSGQVGQVIEIAAGLSGRGLRFTKKHAGLVYLETDLPKMAALKRRLLRDARLLSDRHRVLDLDALKDEGADSLAAIVKTLDPDKGLAIITEGLMSYLDPLTARDVWRRIALHLKPFPHGLYLADAYLTTARHGIAGKIFSGVLGRFVKGRIHVHFESPQHGADIMRDAGFKSAQILEISSLPETGNIGRTPGGDKVRVLEAIV